LTSVDFYEDNNTGESFQAQQSRQGPCTTMAGPRDECLQSLQLTFQAKEGRQIHIAISSLLTVSPVETPTTADTEGFFLFPFS